MVDANIIISAALFPESSVGKVLNHVSKYHKLVLCEYTLNELKNVFSKKFPRRIKYFTDFVKNLKYELISIISLEYKNYPQVRDVDDTPLLAYAIESKVDILLTGDKDFDEIAVEIPRIINPRKYFEEYMQ
jgi:putative PIN family toxin of toxin-antitoxin system